LKGENVAEVEKNIVVENNDNADVHEGKKALKC
jgi:hypothetical protein